MAVSSKDIETLWKRYSCEASKRGISVTQLRFGWDINTFPVYKADENTNKFKEPLTYVNCNKCYEIPVSDFRLKN